MTNALRKRTRKNAIKTQQKITTFRTRRTVQTHHQNATSPKSRNPRRVLCAFIIEQSQAHDA